MSDELCVFLPRQALEACIFFHSSSRNIFDGEAHQLDVLLDSLARRIVHLVLFNVFKHRVVCVKM